jgi:hypothetical protein
MDIKNKVEQRAKETEQKFNAEIKKTDLEKCLNPAFIMKCLKENSLGDSAIFEMLYKNTFLYNKAMDCWMVWSGHHWDVDKLGLAIDAIEGVAKVYEDEKNRLLQKIKEANSNE